MIRDGARRGGAPAERGSGVVFLLRGLPVLIELGLLVYCLVDVIQTPAEDTRNLPKGLWILLVVLLPIVGGIAWLVAGRPLRPAGPPRTTGYPEYERVHRPLAPDDDPQFLAGLRRVDREHERTLDQWEADLRRREEELRRRDRERGEEPQT